MGRGDRQATIEGSQPEHKRCAYKLNPGLIEIALCLWYNTDDPNHCFSADNIGLDNLLITGVRQRRISWIIGIKLSN